MSTVFPLMTLAIISIVLQLTARSHMLAARLDGDWPQVGRAGKGGSQVVERRLQARGGGEDVSLAARGHGELQEDGVVAADRVKVVKSLAFSRWGRRFLGPATGLAVSHKIMVSRLVEKTGSCSFWTLWAHSGNVYAVLR
jgi:hypothetical protein